MKTIILIVFTENCFPRDQKYTKQQYTQTHSNTHLIAKLLIAKTYKKGS
jgi:hypothetical protein